MSFNTLKKYFCPINTSYSRTEINGWLSLKNKWIHVSTYHHEPTILEELETNVVPTKNHSLISQSIFTKHPNKTLRESRRIVFEELEQRSKKLISLGAVRVLSVKNHPQHVFPIIMQNCNSLDRAKQSIKFLENKFDLEAMNIQTIITEIIDEQGKVANVSEYSVNEKRFLNLGFLNQLECFGTTFNS